jgi:hypothetical protein
LQPPAKSDRRFTPPRQHSAGLFLLARNPIVDEGCFMS